jgi:predicted DNA-binding transcriptional regulator YafY
MRASRLVSILLLLQTRGAMTAGELAEQLEVSTRTVYRDVEALSEAGVPIYAERGPHGGVRLVDGYRTRLTGLTVDEAEALFLSGLPGPAAELGLGTVVAAARLKVLAALPPELRARASRVAQRFHLDAPGWFQTTDEVPHLGRLAEAVWETQAVELDYRRPGKSARRRVEPLGLVLKGGTWYLVGATAGQVRTYRVSRVQGLTLTDERFDRPVDFDLVAYWAASTRAYEGAVDRVPVRLRVVPEALGALHDIVGSATMSRTVRREEPDPDGWIRLDMFFDWIDEAETAALRMGSRAEILEPAELRRRVVDSARSVLDRYEAGSVTLG